MVNEFIQEMMNRRSCRKFKSEQITDEQLNAILTAVNMHQQEEICNRLKW